MNDTKVSSRYNIIALIEIKRYKKVKQYARFGFKETILKNCFICIIFKIP